MGINGKKIRISETLIRINFTSQMLRLSFKSRSWRSVNMQWGLWVLWRVCDREVIPSSGHAVVPLARQVFTSIVNISFPRMPWVINKKVRFPRETQPFMLVQEASSIRTQHVHDDLSTLISCELYTSIAKGPLDLNTVTAIEKHLNVQAAKMTDSINTRESSHQLMEANAQRLLLACLSLQS